MKLLERPKSDVAFEPRRRPPQHSPIVADEPDFQPGTPPDSLRWLVLVPIAVLLGLVMRSAWVAEDAYITLRTIDNWVNGFGLRWNAGERVQAYTHPLWMLLLSALYAVSREAYASAIVLGVACTCAGLWLIVKLARSEGHAIAAILLLAASRSFIDFATSGLENPLSHLLLGAFIYCYAIRRDGVLPLSALAALLALNRSDAIVFAAPALVHACLTQLRTDGVKRTCLALAAGLSPLVAWEAFSLWYYGFLVPNTAFAKLNTGISEAELAKQGLIYLKDALAWDPPILALIGVGCAIALGSRQLRLGLLALGCALYLGYVVRIGGDFMLGRFLTLPAFAAACFLARSELPLDKPAVLGLALLPFGLLWLHPNAAEHWPIGTMQHDGIADERAYYHDSTSLMMWTRTRDVPHHYWVAEGLRNKALHNRVVVSGNVGIAGYYAGPDVHIVDYNALTDPLLARLPAKYDPFWRTGHYSRDVPSGYTLSIESGSCQLHDAALCEYYAKLQDIVAGDLWSWSRLATIVRMNLGEYATLIDFDRYRYPGRIELELEQVSKPVAEDQPWNDRSMFVLNNSGALVRMPQVERVAGLELMFDGNDDYAIEFRNGKKLLGTSISRSLEMTRVHTRSVLLPANVQSEGFDTLFIRPHNGDSAYSIGYLRLCL